VVDVSIGSGATRVEYPPMRAIRQPTLRLLSGHIRSSAIPILTSLCVLFLVSCGKGSNTSETPVLSRPPETSYPMPPVKTNSEMGWTVGSIQHVRLSDAHAKVIVLDFYATWCEPCRESIPRLVALQKRYGSQGLEIVGLNVGGEEDHDQIPSFAREFRIQYQLGIPDSELEHLYMGSDGSIPQTVVLDRKGAIVNQFVGYSDSMAEELEELIQSEIAKNANP
jgi:thiol-disulfide isomerase/thioredoxin